jgi:hypothetical protein
VRDTWTSLEQQHIAGPGGHQYRTKTEGFLGRIGFDPYFVNLLSVSGPSQAGQDDTRDNGWVKPVHRILLIMSQTLREAQNFRILAGWG